jgi:diguanylate cyclase (GGDEF)-like protein
LAEDENDPGPKELDPRRTVPMPLRTVLGRVDIPVLRATAGPDILRFVALDGGSPVEIGRDEGCGLVLSDISVSRRHARVVRDADGVAVADLDSSNGTLVNGQLGRHGRLRPGDSLEVGSVPLRLELVSALELEELRAVVRRLEASDRDPLTGLLTRAYLDNDLPGVLERCDRTGTPVSAAFLDLDDFKSVNDRFGHATGDGVLRQLARLLVFVVRDREACVRYGGEEIVVILEDSGEGEAAALAERVRQTVEQHDWSRLAEGLALTLSSGVAERRPHETASAWIGRADRALYAAKHGGRNQVRRASPAGE